MPLSSRPHASRSIRRNDSFTSQAGRTPQRSSAHASLRPYPSKHSLVEQAAARSATAAAAATAASGVSTNAASSTASMGPGTESTVRQGTGGGAGAVGGWMTPGGTHVSEAVVAAAAVAAGAVPSLRAKGFQMSHTLLQRKVSDPDGRGPDGVCAGLSVADCRRHVQVGEGVRMRD